MRNLVGMRWGDLSTEEQEELLSNATPVNGLSSGQGLKNGDRCIVDLTETLSVSGTFISNEVEDSIEIDDNTVIYNSQEGISWKESRQNKYHERHNLKTFSYKIDKNLGEDFKKACEKAGISQSKQLTKMMKKFIDYGKL